MTRVGTEVAGKGAVRKPRVLIVDDDEDTRDMHSFFLQREGFEVDVAEGGLTGIELAQRRQPEIIVLDLTMPRMDGFEVVRRLRADDRTRSTPIIMVSGFARKTDAAAALAAGATSYCLKPCLPETLLQEIRRLLRDITEGNP